VKPNIRIARGQPTTVDIHVIHLPRGVKTPLSDDAQLLALLESKMDRALIARKLQRSVQAVLSRKYALNKRRLVELGLKAKGK
jgi:hypothetical protein